VGTELVFGGHRVRRRNQVALLALALAPNEAKAHASLALVYMWTNRVSQSISEYERALLSIETSHSRTRILALQSTSPVGPKRPKIISLEPFA
jgi:hypothetical protein